jgi:hypothetical protein
MLRAEPKLMCLQQMAKDIFVEHLDDWKVCVLWNREVEPPIEV